MKLGNFKFYKLLLFVGVLLFVFLPLVSSAADFRIVPECMSPGITVTQSDGTTKTVAACGLCDFFLLISNIFQFIAFKLAPPVAGFLFLAAGILFLVSGGSEERASQAKKIFVNAFLGLVVIYTSFLIVSTLINIIGKDVENFHKATWYKFECTTPSSSFNLIKIFDNFQ